MTTPDLTQIGSVYDLIRRDLGGLRVSDRENPESTTFSTSEALMLRASAARLAFVVVNLSANVMFIRPTRVPTTSAGIRLAPNGGSAVVGWKEDFSLPAREWRMIADAGLTNAYYVLEVVLI